MRTLAISAPPEGKRNFFLKLFWPLNLPLSLWNMTELLAFKEELFSILHILFNVCESSSRLCDENFLFIRGKTCKLSHAGFGCFVSMKWVYTESRKSLHDKDPSDPGETLTIDVLKQPCPPQHLKNNVKILCSRNMKICNKLYVASLFYLFFFFFLHQANVSHS